MDLLAVAASLLPALLFCTPAQAQKPEFFDYPAPKPIQQQFDFSQVPSFLSWDMELRSRTEGQTSLNEASGNDRIYDLTRVRGGLTVNFTDFLRGYIQFQDTHALGLPVPQVASNQRDTFDDFQAYLDIHPIDNLDLVTGRQMLRYGDERVVGISDWTNNSRTWDGFDGHYGNKNWIEAFATSVVAVHPESLDKHGAGLTFYGILGNYHSEALHLDVIPFEFIRRVLSVSSQQSIHGGELENTFGGEINGSVGNTVFYDVMGDLQRGPYSNDFIHAGAGLAKVGYQVNAFRWKPRFGGEYDYATGNTHRDPFRIGTYDQQYPSDHNAFGLTDLFGFDNITQARVNVDMKPAEKWTLLFQTEFLNVASIHDSVYSGAETVLVKVPTNGFSATDIGQGFDASTDYLFRKYLDVQFGVGHVFPGRVLADNGKAPPLTLGYFQLTYRFKLNHQQ